MAPNGCCQCWFSRDQAHLTDEHETRAKLKAQQSQSSIQSEGGSGSQQANILQTPTAPTTLTGFTCLWLVVRVFHLQAKSGPCEENFVSYVRKKMTMTKGMSMTQK